MWALGEADALSPRSQGLRATLLWPGHRGSVPALLSLSEPLGPFPGDGVQVAGRGGGHRWRVPTRLSCLLLPTPAGSRAHRPLPSGGVPIRLAAAGISPVVPCHKVPLKLLEGKVSVWHSIAWHIGERTGKAGSSCEPRLHAVRSLGLCPGPPRTHCGRTWPGTHFMGAAELQKEGECSGSPGSTGQVYL